MRLINPNEIEFTMVPIMARSYARASVHYELVAFQQDIRQIQKIEAEPVRHAHVVWTIKNSSYHTQCCSNCHRTFISRPDETIEFCPHCGAKMDAEREGK